jgi:chromosomal replication initiator protein
MSDELMSDEQRSETERIDLIRKTVAAAFELKPEDLTAIARGPVSISFPRQIGMYLARKFTGSYYHVIAEHFGRCSHATVIHACHEVNDRMDVEPQTREKITRLAKLLSIMLQKL